MKVVYIHGAGGDAAEAEHFKALFPGMEVMGFDYRATAPWDAIDEFRPFFEGLTREHSLILIANSIGAFFAMHALADMRLEKAFFISPIVDMEALITKMMQWAGVTERELEEKGRIQTSFGEELSWEYLTWVRNHPITWHQQTSILYGSKDSMQSSDIMQAFAKRCHATLTVMDQGEHWFHTEEQMQFLDQWVFSDNAYSE